MSLAYIQAGVVDRTWSPRWSGCLGWSQGTFLWTGERLRGCKQDWNTLGLSSVSRLTFFTATQRKGNMMKTCNLRSRSALKKRWKAYFDALGIRQQTLSQWAFRNHSQPLGAAWKRAASWWMLLPMRKGDKWHYWKSIMSSHVIPCLGWSSGANALQADWRWRSISTSQSRQDGMGLPLKKVQLSGWEISWKNDETWG